MRRTFVLIILDGWGIGEANESNPIHVVGPRTFTMLEERFPLTTLHASGISVGLPWGETGNSEVGHLTIGAGKILYQYYPKISLAIRDGSFFTNTALKAAFLHAKEKRSAINLIGLLSKGNVHASLEHLKALIQMARKEGVPIKLHLFADGKDSPPHSIDKFLKEIPIENLASLTGRHYAMDREGHWTLTQKAYETMMGKGGMTVEDPWEALRAHYAQALSEEFLPPLRIGKNKEIQDGDAIIFFNFREDSIRQLAAAFIEEGFNAFETVRGMHTKIVTMTPYKETFAAEAAFMPDRVKTPLGKVLSETAKTQLRIAETYKYAHITYFFNGYEERPFTGEYRVLIPSPAVPHIDAQPQMRAAEITDRLIQAVEESSFDFILTNYANPDTIAHTGNYNASLEAVRVIDRELGRFIKVAEEKNAAVMITSDHGNIEELFDPATGTKETQHDPNPVPLYLVMEEWKGKKFPNSGNLKEPIGTLADIAPTLLRLMALEAPREMTGYDLLKDLR